MNANQNYIARLTKINDQIIALQEALEQHAKLQSKDQANWGFVGDLGYIDGKLAELNDFTTRLAK